MSNPLMQQMGGAPAGAPGPFPANLTRALQAAGMLNVAMQAASAYKAGKLDEFAQHLYQTNPQFRAFADANKGKTLGQMAQENGVDLGQVSSVFK